MYKILTLSILFLFCFGCKTSKNIQGRYYSYPSKNNSSYIVNIKDSSLFLFNNDNSSGQYIYSSKNDTLFLRTLDSDSTYWKNRQPIKYGLINKGYIFIDNCFPNHELDAYYDLKHPILVRKGNMFFTILMTILYRNELKRLLIIKNKSSRMKCLKIFNLFKQDCTIKLYHQLSKRDLGI